MCWQIREMVAGGGKDPWPPCLGLFKSVQVTLTYLRRNRVQVDLAETFGVSQSTISRAVAAMTTLLGKVVADWVPAIQDLPTGSVFVVDGSLLPCWSWRTRNDLHSGKHKTTGMNIQVTATVAGTLVHVSAPLPGSVHDLTALRTHQLLDGRPADQWIADKGYQGSGMLTPHKKPIGGELTDDRKEVNTVINSHRAVIERVIAHLKTWRILHTDYRRPINTFPETIATVIALHFYTLNP